MPPCEGDLPCSLFPIGRNVTYAFTAVVWRSVEPLRQGRCEPCIHHLRAIVSVARAWMVFCCRPENCVRRAGAYVFIIQFTATRAVFLRRLSNIGSYMTTETDYYRALGVSKSASEDEIRKA